MHFSSNKMSMESTSDFIVKKFEKLLMTVKEVEGVKLKKLTFSVSRKIESKAVQFISNIEWTEQLPDKRETNCGRNQKSRVSKNNTSIVTTTTTITDTTFSKSSEKRKKRKKRSRKSKKGYINEEIKSACSSKPPRDIPACAYYKMKISEK